jgi:DNA-binding NarL/FixJ family response regulator
MAAYLWTRTFRVSMSAILKQTSILLADDHPGALAQTARLLSLHHGIAGTATNGEELLEAVPRLDPDVIVLDISMPGVDGFEAARRLKKAGCRSKLIFLTVWEDADFVREAMALGADGYVVKSRLASDLMPAISEVLGEHKFVSPTMKTYWPQADPCI